MQIDPNDAGLKNPPNEFGTLKPEKNCLFCRAFVPEPGVTDLLKSAKRFARVKIATLDERGDLRPLAEKDMYNLLYGCPSPYKEPMKKFTTYVENMILIFSQSDQEHMDQFMAVRKLLSEKKMKTDSARTDDGFERDGFHTYQLSLNIVNDKLVILGDQSEYSRMGGY